MEAQDDLVVTALGDEGDYQQREYHVAWTTTVLGTSWLDAAREAAEEMRGTDSREADEFEVYDPTTGTTIMVDLGTVTGREFPGHQGVHVVIDHGDGGTTYHVFVDGVETDPDDHPSPAAFHIIDPGSEDENPGHEWYETQATHQPDTSATVQALLNTLARAYHRCDEGCLSFV